MHITLLDIEKMSTNQDNAAMFINSTRGKHLGQMFLKLYNLLTVEQRDEVERIGLFR